MINETLSKLVLESLYFVVPDEQEILSLLDSKDLYREYGMALAWMQDYLLNYTRHSLHPHLKPDESKHYIQEIIGNGLLLPLVDNLVKNQAVVLRLAEAVQSNPESVEISTIINQFLDDMADWQGHLSESDRLNDMSIAIKYLSELESQEIRFEIINARAVTTLKGIAQGVITNAYGIHSSIQGQRNVVRDLKIIEALQKARELLEKEIKIDQEFISQETTQIILPDDE